MRRLAQLLLFLAILAPSPSWAREPSRKAAEAFARGDLAEAESEVVQGALAHPEDPDPLRELAAIREEADDPTAAAALYAQAATLSGDPGTEVEAAACRARSGDPRGAQEILERILGDRPEDPGALWYLALTHRLLAKGGGAPARGHWRSAREALKTLTRVAPASAAAYRLLGECHEALGDGQDAEAAYETALRYEPSYKDLHARLARLLKKRGATAQALARYERAVASTPWDKSLARERAALVRRSPDTAQVRRTERNRKWRELKPLTETPLPSSATTLRIGLETQVHRLVLRCAGTLEVTSPALTPLAKLASDTDYVVAWTDAPRGGKGQGPVPLPTLIASQGENPLVIEEDAPGLGSGVLMDAKGNTLLTFDRRLWFQPADPAHTVALHAVETGSGYFFAGEEDRFYRGLIEIHPGPGEGFGVINRVNLESYVAGVLPSEMPASWPLEALKAQAVAARTEGMTKLGRHNREGFDLCDEVHCQAYVGIKAERAATNRAVAETAGLVLWRGGRPFPAVYSAQCGGHTQSYQEAWGYDLPASGVGDFDPAQVKARFPLAPHELKEWILTEPAAYCRVADLKGYQQFRWSFPVSAAELGTRERLREIGPLTGVKALGRSQAGWVGRVVFEGEKGPKDFTRDSVRGILGGIRSNLFWLEDWRDPSGQLQEVWIYGGGWGHGVGLCQVGAMELARLGRDFKSILRHYYPKASFRKF